MKEEVKKILEKIGEDINREGIKATPTRVDRLFHNIFYGYRKRLVAMTEEERNNNKIDKNVIPITIFKNNGFDGMIIRSTEVKSFCEHHIVPFIGRAWIGIVPDKAIIGMNKIDKIVKYFSARLQIQERLTEQVADWLQNNLKPQGVMVVIKANHLCAELQGDNGNFTTSSVRGVFADDSKPRAEFLELIK